MLFKNVIIYHLTKPFNIPPATMAEAMESRKFIHCSGLRASSFGWVPPILDEDKEISPLLHEVNGCYVFKARQEKKVIPPSALNEAVDEKVKLIEAAEDRKIRAREKKTIKENTVAELLPRALPKSSFILGYIAPTLGWLVIDARSMATAEIFINCIRDSLGLFAVVPAQVNSRPSDIFTRWVREQKSTPETTIGDNQVTEIVVADECELRDIDDAAAISCRHQDLGTTEILTHLDAGKTCTTLRIRYGDLRATITSDLSLRKLKFDGITTSHDGDENPYARFDAEFVNVALELQRFMPVLYETMGGLATSETANHD